MISKNITLWFGAENRRVRVPVSQYDTMWQFEFTIINGSVVWTIPADSSAVLNGLKPDGNVFAFSGTIANNKVTVNADVQMTAVAGETICELCVTNDGKVIGTANFLLVVESAPKSPNDVSSESTLPAYETMLDALANVPYDIHESVTDWLDDHPEATTTVQDGAITTAKLADNAVTSGKIADHTITVADTDFCYQASVVYTAPWFSFSGGDQTVGKLNISADNYATAAAQMPDVFSMVVKVNNQYWAASQHMDFRARTSGYTTHTFPVTHTSTTKTVNGQMYGIVSWTREDFLSAYNTYLDAVEQSSLIPLSFDGTFGNVAARFSDKPFAVADTVTTEMIESGFIEQHISQDFVNAVYAAINSTGDESTVDEQKARTKLSGKVMICLGDSYTKGMETQLDALAAKYEMVCDNRGIVSSSFAGTYDPNTGSGTGFQPMWRRANTIVTDYTNGFVIDEHTYTKTDVGLIVVMGGANDGFGVSTWIGTGINDTDTAHIYGAANHIFNVMQKTFTGAKTICITQPSNYSREVSSISTDAAAQAVGFDSLAQLQVMDDVQFSNYAMAKKERAIKETAWSYGVPVLDMFTEFPTVFNPANRSTYWSSDKLHLTGTGYNLIKTALDKKLVKIVVG